MSAVAYVPRTDAGYIIPPLVPSTPEALDLACWPIFERMTARGIRVDMGRLHTLRADVVAELETQEAALGIYAGRDLDPHSPDDVRAWLVKEGLAGRRRTRGGAISTDERALSQLVDLHPVPGCVLECRGLRKLLGTFIDPVIEVAATTGNVIHPKWNLTKVKSGRVACGGRKQEGAKGAELERSLNLLAFPQRDKLGRRVRDCFVARPGHVLVSVDFSQIQPRIAAGLSRDPAMLKVFTNGEDLYADLARRIFKRTEPDAWFKLEPQKTTMRHPAKTILLGCVLFGMQADKLHDELIESGCGTPAAPFYSHEACDDFVRRRFEPYPEVGRLFQRVCAEARAADGWVYTSLGRGRFLPALLLDGGRRWPNEKLRAEAERQAFNHVIQGDEQDIVKPAMLRADRLPMYPLLQMHDEVVYEVLADGAEGRAAEAAAVMATTLHGVEIKTVWGVAESWGGLK